MVTDTEPNDANKQTVRPADVQSLISWRHLGVASILGLLSLIDEWQITEGFKVSGGATLIALAAVVLLWPVVRQVAVRGGEIDLKGLRLKVNQIENEAQRIENDNAMRIQELESELEDLRSQGPAAAQNAGQDAGGPSPDMEDDISVLQWAVDSYRSAAPLQDFRKRVEIDKEIVRRGRHLSLTGLSGFLESQSWSTEAQMAVAVALGLMPRKDEELERARLLAQLLASSGERVRARAGQAAKRWGERRGISRNSRSVLLGAIENRLLEESPTSGARGYLEKAREILLATRDWSEA